MTSETTPGLVMRTIAGKTIVAMHPDPEIREPIAIGRIINGGLQVSTDALHLALDPETLRELARTVEAHNDQ